MPGSVLRPTDGEARLLAHRLLRTARYGAIAVLDPESGAPLASRVGVATDLDGAPLILVSLLSAHTKALLADPRCALLVGEPGRGDALAHPRLALSCTAVALAGERRETAQAARRYLNRNPKAQLYAGLGDFRWFRLEPGSAMLNGGFGKAYRLTAADILVPTPAGLAALEQEAIDHMNRDHRDADRALCARLCGCKARQLVAHRIGFGGHRPGIRGFGAPDCLSQAARGSVRPAPGSGRYGSSSAQTSGRGVTL